MLNFARGDILVVDDDVNILQLLGRILENVGTLRYALNGDDALRQASEQVPELVLLDAEMPGATGLQVLANFQADPRLSGVPIIFVTSHGEPEFEVRALEMGAVDFITKPVNGPVVLARVKTHLRIQRLSEELRLASETDALTGIANRRRYENLLEQEWYRARRSFASLSLLLIDVDHFKLYNDHYGHPAGDACLRAVAQALLQASLRPTDLVARVGGEEFAILLSLTPHEGAAHVASSVLASVRALGIPHAASPTAPSVTVSVGVASYDEKSSCWIRNNSDDCFRDEAQRPSCSAAQLVKAADLALYSAKNSGRARALALDIGDIHAPHLARQILPSIPSANEVLEIAADTTNTPSVWEGESSSGQTSKMTLCGVRLLVADDNSDNLETTAYLLQTEGAEVWKASNGQDALDQIGRDPTQFHAVILDVRMPVLDGLSATTRIRDELGLRNLPVIGLSGDGLQDDHRRATAAGMDDYLVKPYEIQTLLSCILRRVKPDHGQSSALYDFEKTDAPWPEVPGIDSNAARARLRGDFGLFRVMLGRVLEEFCDGGLKNQGEGQASLALGSSRMHKLKGSAGTLGATAIHMRASEAEAAYRRGETQEGARLEALLNGEMNELKLNTAFLFSGAQAAPDRASPP